MSVLLKRHATPEDIQVQQCTGLDGQGKPTYNAAVSIKGNVLRHVAVTRSNNAVLMQPGDQVDVMATVWVDGEQSRLPAENDRITLADGSVGIVVDFKERRWIQSGIVDHVRVKLREE